MNKLYTQILPFDLAKRLRGAGFTKIVYELNFAEAIDWLYTEHGLYVYVNPSFLDEGKFTAYMHRCNENGVSYDQQIQKDGIWLYFYDWEAAAAAGIEMALDYLDEHNQTK